MAFRQKLATIASSRTTPIQPPTSEKNPIIYTCIMEVVECSKAGWLFAVLTKIIGNPLSPHQDQDVKMEVRLTTRPNKTRVYWCRTYHFPHKKPFSVTSVKKDDRGQMMELVGGGFGMCLYHIGSALGQPM